MDFIWFLVNLLWLMPFSAGSSVLDVFGLNHQPLVPMEELLMARSSGDLKALGRARQLIKTLDSLPTCAHAPTSRLLRQCKNTKSLDNHIDTAQHLETAKSIYAISLAVCETRDAKVSIPSLCYAFVHHFDFDSEDSMAKVVHVEELAGCLAELKTKHYFWTSYSNNRQNANDLCDSSRIDYQREELLDVYRQLSSALPEFTMMLQFHGRDISTLSEMLHASSKEFVGAQQTVTIQQEEQLVAFQNMLDTQFQSVVGNVNSFSALLADVKINWQAALKNSTREAHKDIQALSLNAEIMHTNLNGFYASVQETVSALVFDYATSIDLWRQQTGDVIQQIVELGSSTNLDNIREHVTLSQKAAADFEAIQTRQIDKGNQLALSLQSSSARVEALARSIDNLPFRFLSSLGDLWAMRHALLRDVQLATLVTAVTILLFLAGWPTGAKVVLLTSGKLPTLFCWLRTNDTLVILRTTWSYLSEFPCAFPVDETELKTLILIAVSALTAYAVIFVLFRSLQFLSNIYRKHKHKTEASKQLLPSTGMVKSSPNRFRRAASAPVEHRSDVGRTL